MRCSDRAAASRRKLAYILRGYRLSAVRRILRRFASTGALAILAGCATADSGGPSGPLPVVQGAFEPDYLFPWTVQLPGCRGVLVSPRWVLTAAHCVMFTGTTATIRRTDPSGQTHLDERSSAPAGVRIHPEFDLSKSPSNDIALVRLEKPFDILPYSQVVGLPRDARHAGVTGAVAGNTHTGMLPPGQLAVFRAPMPADGPPFGFTVSSTAASGSLCPGDSGSGFVTVEGRRAVVRGVASQVSINNCTTAAGWLVDFIDVFHYRAWILDTMRVTDDFLDGNTRLRRNGRLARGVMGIGCSGAVVWGPLYVRGVQEGANCENEQQQSVICALEAGQPRLRITKFTMRTAQGDGSVTVENLPFSDRLAAFFGIRPFGAFREFDCTIGSTIGFDIDPPVVIDPTP